MQYRTLWRTGIKVSPYALGALALGTSIGNPDHDDSIRIIHKALDAGITLPAGAQVPISGRLGGYRNWQPKRAALALSFGSAVIVYGPSSSSSGWTGGRIGGSRRP
jgi:hypothetical protein